jgi:serine protease Do
MAGQVIGINTLIRPDAQGIGFAIPVDTALKVADELKRFGKVKRPWLGLIAMSNSRYLIERFGLPDAEGAVVRGVYRGGPVVDLGLEQGDVITKLAGKAVKGEDDLKAIERSLKIGEMADIEWRNGERLLKGRVKVGESP